MTPIVLLLAGALMSEWTIVNSTSPMNDELYSRFVLAGEYSPAREEKPLLTVSCRKGKFETIYFTTGGLTTDVKPGVGGKPSDDGLFVHWRTDADKPNTTWMYSERSLTSFTFRYSSRSVKKILNSALLRVQFDVYPSGVSLAEFEPSSSSQAALKVACSL